MTVIGVVDPAPSERHALAGRAGLTVTSALDGPRDAELDVLVVGSLAADPLASARRLHRLHPGAAIVTASPPGDEAALRLAVEAAADLPADLLVVDPAASDLAAAVAAAGERVARERRRRVLLAAVGSPRPGEPD